jgi:ATP-dependent DNA helicase RecG
MISQTQLDQLLGKIEQDRVEKTISVNDGKKFGEAICAFSNDFPDHRQPGYLIVGVHDDGRRSNLPKDEKILQNLMDFRTDGRIVPPPVITVAWFDYPDGFVAVAEVQPAFQPPVRFNGAVHLRIGPRRGVATEAEERILSEKRSSFAKSFDTLPCRESTLQDLSLGIFRSTYLPTAIDAETLAANGRDLKEQLASLKFYDLKADCPTHAAILMFGTNPRFFLESAYVQYVRFAGNDETSSFEYEYRFEGDLTTQMRRMDEFIQSPEIVKKVLPALGQAYQANYPAAALKELLYNAVIHRDYQSNAPIKFYQFSNRLEISNPGGLFGQARPENFPNQNDYRNPTLAEAAKNLGFVNRFSVGIKRVQNEVLKNGNPEVKFIFDQPSSFSATVYQKS